MTDQKIKLCPRCQGSKIQTYQGLKQSYRDDSRYECEWCDGMGYVPDIKAPEYDDQFFEDQHRWQAEANERRGIHPHEESNSGWMFGGARCKSL